jgi:putative hydrolase of the HAD superfamily
MDLQEYRVVIFDLFHTLTSADVLRLPGKGTSEILGVSREAWNEQLLRFSDDRLRGKITDPFMIIARMARAIDRTISDETIREAVENRINRFRRALMNIEDSTRVTLRELRRVGKSLGLISNADVNEIAGWDDSPLKPYFDCVVFSCRVGYVKPERQIYERALKEFGVEARHILYVGDGGSDELRGAKDMGMNTVLTTHVIKQFWPERIVKARQYADFEINELTEIIS